MKLKLPILYILFLMHTVLTAQSNSNEAITIGTIDTIHSKVLNENRVIYIHTPVNYEEMDNIPLVFVLDAYSQFNQSVSTIDYISNGAQGNDIMPASIVIGITNPNRDFDFTPVKGLTNPNPSSVKNTGGAPQFLEFITTELIPFLDSTYNTCHHRTLIGHSLGGLFVFHALLEKPEYFSNYLAIDPAIGFGNGAYFQEILDSLSTKELSNKYLYFANADNRPKGMSLEELEKTNHLFLINCDKFNRKFSSLQETNDWPINLKKVFYTKEDHFSVPFRATYDAFRYFYDYYQFQYMNEIFYSKTADPENDLINLKKHFSMISDRIGCESKPQIGYINSWAWGISLSEKKKLANDMFLYNIELHKDIPIVYSNYGYYLQHIGKDKEAVEQFEKHLSLEKNENILTIKNEIIKKMNYSNRK